MSWPGGRGGGQFARFVEQRCEELIINRAVQLNKVITHNTSFWFSNTFYFHPCDEFTPLDHNPYVTSETLKVGKKTSHETESRVKSLPLARSRSYCIYCENLFLPAIITKLQRRFYFRSGSRNQSINPMGGARSTCQPSLVRARHNAASRSRNYYANGKKQCRRRVGVAEK